MLLDHYGLREQPFGVTPNPRYLYLSPSHREALASLVYGIESGRGFLALIASPGMGKTTLLVQLLERLGNTARTVFLFQAQHGSRDFLRSMMSDLGVSAEEDDVVVLQARLNELLLDELKARRKFVLVVDEAQNLDDSALEFVRMLSNFETPRDKLMHIVLAGQTQLAEKLALPSMVQLRQRISMLIRLRPLGAAETAEYIAHRLRVAGRSGAPLFSAGAVSAIASLSGGIPRNINTFCFNALSLGYASGLKKIDSAVVQEVAADLDLSSFRAEHPGAMSALQPHSPGERLAQTEPGAGLALAKTEGWAVVLDRIIPAAAARPDGETAAFGVRDLSWRSSSWQETVESLAGRRRDRTVH